MPKPKTARKNRVVQVTAPDKGPPTLLRLNDRKFFRGKGFLGSRPLPKKEKKK